MNTAADEYGPATYGDRIADVYDEWYKDFTKGESAVDFLAGLAGDGPALELGIGTGRLALPLQARGVPVHGIDASEAMVEVLRAKPGGADLPVTMGDFADVAVDGTYSMVFVTFCTFFALLTQEDQVRCFANVAARLSEEGTFVVEAFGHWYPKRFSDTQGARATTVETNRVILETGRYDPLEQVGFIQFVVITEGGTRMFPMKLRYASPSEIDLMARLAGLRLRERWAGWDREPFTVESRTHISVYERDPAAQR